MARHIKLWWKDEKYDGRVGVTFRAASLAIPWNFDYFLTSPFQCALTLNCLF